MQRSFQMLAPSPLQYQLLKVYVRYAVSFLPDLSFRDPALPHLVSLYNVTLTTL